MFEIINLTASSPIFAPIRAPNPTPSIEWIKTEPRDNNYEFLNINELIKDEKLFLVPAIPVFRRRRSPSRSSNSSLSNSSLEED